MPACCSLADEVVPAAVAILRVFIAHGDRTDRTASAAQIPDRPMGHRQGLWPRRPRTCRFPGAMPRPRSPSRAVRSTGTAISACTSRPSPGFAYIGVVPPVGRLTVAQLRGLAAIAERRGSGTVRLTVWQNLLISDIPDEAVGATARRSTRSGSRRGQRNSRRACGLHRQCRLQVRACRHQAARAGARRVS